MTQTGGTDPTQGARPPRPPQAPGKGGLSYKSGLGTIFADLFNAIASLYTITTTGDLQTLNEQLTRETEALQRIGAEIAATPPSCSQRLADLKNQQQLVQTQLGSLNISMSTMTSAAATQAKTLGSIVDTVKGLLMGVTSNW